MKSINKRAFGSRGEQIALDYLLKNHYKILKKNFRVGRSGEIDIIASENDYICFIEVKTRSNTVFGTPAEAVGKVKQQSITRLANIYLMQNNSFNKNIRFDIIEILYTRDCTGNRSFSINHIKNAF